ncbi:type VI secretion system tube protein TssD [Granulicella tundricola]|uniref:Type VI secretion system effector, Hcp1 family n=1 Tax=Granulicella tundricola (strain ATCC BAA-1859 / DSM 23138 / MP5ACTX9) TaxID=1198114 RepID=E8X1M5_GRATM|nr:type VI secretion system tube protein TssD [Granulicella tundricola]ADW67944.1 type VI secretion system effector, Hcp1 family [Granulicella tundricola MP5ACTX9]
MALNAYLTLKGQKQGQIIGSVTQKGRENSILVHAYSNQIVSPRDPASGLPTGERMHQPLSIVKEIDKSSPLLWNAFNTNENLTQWTLQFWSPALATTPLLPERQIYTITLTNASIASIHESMLDNEDPTRANYTLREEITFTYQKIQWLWTDGGITASDDWEAPVA